MERSPTLTPDRDAFAQVEAIDAYDFLGYRAAIGASSADALVAIRSILRGFGPVDVGPGLNLPRYEIITTSVGWQLRIDGAAGQESKDFLTVLGALEWSVVSAALSQRDDLFQLHGAALCLPTRRAGIVLVGGSRSGKTTLALALMLRGFVLFSDDVTLIDPETLDLHAMKRACHVSDDTRGLLESLTTGSISWDEAEPRGYFSPPQWAEEPVPVRWVLLPEYEPRQEPQLVPLAPAEAATAILAQSPSLARGARLALSTTARLVERAQVYRFESGDLEASVAMVQRLVAST